MLLILVPDDKHYRRRAKRAFFLLSPAFIHFEYDHMKSSIACTGLLFTVAFAVLLTTLALERFTVDEMTFSYQTGSFIGNDNILQSGPEKKRTKFNVRSFCNCSP